MRRLLWLLPALALMCSACALWKPTPPLEAVEPVRVLGFDLGDGVRLSATTGADRDAERISAEGATIEAALETLRARSLHGSIFFGHTSYLLVGEDFARAGLEPLLSLALDSAALRPATPLVVLRGEAADAVLSDTLDVNARLTALERTGFTTPSALEAADAAARGGVYTLGAVRYDAEADVLVPAGRVVMRGGKLIGFTEANNT